MTLNEVMTALQKVGSEKTKKTFMNHGACEPLFGVKVADLKILQKKIKKDYELALALFATGNSDAMYFAGLIADEKQMTKDDLQRWVKEAYWYYLSEFTVPWVAAESPYGWELAKEWIESEIETTASAGWATYANLVILNNDTDLPIPLITQLLKRVSENIHQSQNRVRYTMNGFVIAVGSSVKPLITEAEKVAQTIGKVKVDMGITDCKVPLATEYIDKIKNSARWGFKKKGARC